MQTSARLASRESRTGLILIAALLADDTEALYVVDDRRDDREGHADVDEEDADGDRIGVEAGQPPFRDEAEALDLIPDVLKNQDLTQPITRAEFAAVVVKVFENLSGGKAVPIVNNPFTDTKDVEVLKAYGIGAVNGTSATTFTPNALLNREQCATMLTRVFKRSTMPGWTLDADSQFKLSYTMPAR
ncbi:MAG: hypothetical protein IJR41_00820, partial [Atopobiaceae bacterium]|nr:hypothetical protein [Atopobiaceae bacterium]